MKETMTLIIHLCVVDGEWQVIVNTKLFSTNDATNKGAV